MDTLDVIFKRASCRKYLPEPLPEADIEKLLEAGLASPTAKNRQSLRFNLINSAEYKEKISEQSLKLLGEKVRTFLASMGANNIFYDAPHVLIISSVGSHYEFIDGGIAAQSIALAAESMGYATCYIGFARLGFDRSDETNCCDLLNFEPEEKFIAALAIGKADGPVKEPHSYTRDHIRRFG